MWLNIDVGDSGPAEAQALQRGRASARGSHSDVDSHISPASESNASARSVRRLGHAEPGSAILTGLGLIMLAMTCRTRRD